MLGASRAGSSGRTPCRRIRALPQCASGDDAGRIGTHISNEADGAFFAELHAFIQALRDHHGALHAEAQLAGGILLQFAGGEWRRGIAAAFFLIDRSNHPIGIFQSGADLFRFFGVANFDLLFALADETRVEGRRLAGSEVGINRPVFFLLERLDLAFALDDQTQCDGLHASGGETSTDFVPEQRRNLIANQAVENTAGLLRVDQILIDGARMFERCLHGALGDFVEGHALNARRSFLLALLRFLSFFFP